MDFKTNAALKMLEAENYSSTFEKKTEAAKRFVGVPGCGYSSCRTLMIDKSCQAGGDKYILSVINFTNVKSDREKELENKVKALEENLRVRKELLLKIRDTTAKTSLLIQEQAQMQPNKKFISNTYINHGNLINNPSNSGLPLLSHAIVNATKTAQQPSPPSLHATSAKSSLLNSQEQARVQPIMEFNSKSYINHGNFINSPRNSELPLLNPAIVNAAKTPQQPSTLPSETINYTIIAEGTGNSNEEPIEIHLAEDDGALNLNSSADSGRLEICLAPTENIQLKTECNTMLTQERMVPNTLLIITPKDQQMHGLPASANACHDAEPLHDIPQQTPNKKRRRRTETYNSLKTPKMKCININNDLHSQPSRIESLNGTTLSSQNNAVTSAENEMVPIGPNNTLVPSIIYKSIDWTSASIATRKLLMATFDRDVLATHSLTGKASPAFKGVDKPVKQMLNPLIIADIIRVVTEKCKVSEKEVRNAITTKCSDENKMMKLQKDRQNRIIQEEEKENIENIYKINQNQ